MDGRMEWWIGWKTAARDHDTFCVSCHTVAPYAMGRPALRSALHEPGPSDSERKLVENVAKRVRLWNELEPYYSDAARGTSPKPADPAAREAILNALVLKRYKSPDLPRALENMWAQQIADGDDQGAFPWLQFHNSPWEGDSQYYGAALAAIVAGENSSPAAKRAGCLPDSRGRTPGNAQSCDAALGLSRNTWIAQAGRPRCHRHGTAWQTAARRRVQSFQPGGGLEASR